MKVPTIEPLEARIAPAVLTITALDPSKTEGSTSGSTTNFSFKVTLDAPEPQDVTVLAKTVDGTAKLADGDFNAFSQTITIPKGQTEMIFTVPIKQDTDIEADETFSVSLSSPSSNAVIGTTGTATSTILNDDAPKVSIVALDPILSEGSKAGDFTNFRFDVVLDRVAAQDVTVQVTLKDGTAKVGDGDFAAFTQLVTIPAGQLKAAAPVSIPVNQDTANETDENFSVELSSPSSNAVLGSSVSTSSTIRNDDPPKLRIEDAKIVEGALGETSKLQFKVKLTSEASGDVTFDWSTISGTAAAGIDFTSVTNTTATIPAGATEVIIEVDILGDNDDEPDQNFNVNLTNAKLQTPGGPTTLTIEDTQATGTIQNDELSVSITGPSSVTEGNAGSNSATYTLNLGQTSNHSVTVVLEVLNGTALAGTDFTVPTTLTVTIPANSASANFVVPIRVDNVFEADETFQVRVKSVADAVLTGGDTVTTTILNDDTAPTISIGNLEVGEGNVSGTSTLTVNLSAAAGKDITFKWSTVNGTAIAGQDFEGVTEQLVTIPAGQTSATLTVTRLGDKVFEKDETFTVALSDVNGATVPNGGGVSTITLKNDEAAPTLSIANAQVFEGEGANPRLGFVVSIDNGVTSDQPIQFNWTAGLGTATPGVDYQLVSTNPATIPAGATSVTLFIDVLDDAVNELDETLNVDLGTATLQDGTAVVKTDANATGKILNDDLAISIAPVASPVPEGNTGNSIAKYRVSIPAPSAHDVSVVVQFDPENSTAALGSDFSLPASTTVVIPAGQSFVDFDVTILGDTAFETDEVITLKLANPVNATIDDGSASLTVTNDDTPPQIFIENSSLAEGDGGIVNMTFTVRLTNAASEDVTFDWSTVDGVGNNGAIGGVDFSKVESRQATIPAGATSATITVALSGDTVDELDENFSVVIGNAMLGNTALAINDDTATGTIKNDDLTVRISGASLTEGNSGTSNLNFAVSIPQASDHDVTVTFEVVAGSATTGVDYTIPATLTKTIPAGQTVAFISVPIIGDALHEVNESFVVNLTSAANAKLGVSSATGTILNDDAAPALSIGDIVVAEGNTGSAEYQFTISLSSLSGQDITVLVTPRSGTGTANQTAATLGTDFSGEAKTVTIPAGMNFATVTLGSIFGDASFENDESFLVELSNATGATIADGTATGTITNDDIQPSISISNVSVDEAAGMMNFVISYTGDASGFPVTFTAATSDGTAKAGQDYTAKTQNFTIPAGQTSATFSVAITNDSLYEASEAFNVALTNVSGATVGNGTATGTIVDNDPRPTITVSDLTVLEGDGDPKAIKVLVSLSSAAGSDVTFNWEAIAGTAGLNDDYTVDSPSSLTIPAGQTSVQIELKIVGDLVDEVDEKFSIKLTNPQLDGSALAFTNNDDTAAVTILNDDLSLSISDATIVEGDSGTPMLQFTVTLSGDNANEIKVNYATQDGTATSSGTAKDFTATTGTLTFAPHTNEQTISVPITPDMNFDGTDSFTVLLSNSVNARIADGNATGTITDDDDARPSASIEANKVVVENADVATTPGVTKMEFKVKLDHASDETVEVSFSTVDGTAKGGLDFTAITNQRVSFAPGETEKTITVEVLNDSVFEAAQSFSVILSDPLRATLGADKERTGTIQPDADAAPTLKLTGQTLLEGDNGERFVNFVVQRTGQTDEPITFQFNTIDGTAVSTGADADFVALVNEPFTMLPSETSKTVKVSVAPDLDDETDESFSATITPQAGATLAVPADGTATATLLNDDLTVSLQQGVLQVLEGNSGDTDMVFTVVLSSANSTHATEVTYTVNGISATADVDYKAPTVLKLVIPAGSQTGEIRIPIIGDGNAESNETLSVTLTGAKDAELATSDLTATGTILNDDASLSISNARLVEGTNGSAMMEFVVTLDAPFTYPVTVNYSTTDGTALSGSDYTAVTGTLNFALGETSKIVQVPILGDTSVEGDENFTVTLSSPTGAQIANGAGTGTIQDDESFLSIDDVTIEEGDGGTRTMTFTITRAPGSAVESTVRVSTLDGTAISTGPAADYIAKSEVLTFAANETKKTFSVVVKGDLVFESDSEMFQVVLSEATGAAILDGTGTGTIDKSMDTKPALQIANASVTEGDSGTKVLKFVVSLTHASDSDVSFNFQTALAAGADPAVAGDDYTAVNQQFTIPAGQTSVEISVPVLGDLAPEADEFLLGRVTNADTDIQAIGTILNDDLTVSIVSTSSETEGDAAGVMLKTRVNLFDANGQLIAAPRAIKVTFQVSNGTAIAGTDFTLPLLSVTIEPGQTGADIEVPLTGDVLDEGNETFTITLTGVEDAELGDTIATATITDNDPLPVITVADVSVDEGSNAVFTVNLSAPSGRDVVVKWVTEFVPGSAEPSDYTHMGAVQTLVIPAGQTSGTITIATTNDSTDELDETFKLHILSTTENANVGNDGVLATGTIKANDFGKFTIGDATITEGTGGNTKTLTFTVTRDGALNLPASVNYNTQDGTARASVGDVVGDYIAANGTLNFAAGESTKTIVITINGDDISEVDENFFVTLSGEVNGTFADKTANGRILNDEVTYSLEFENSVVETLEDGTDQSYAVFRVVRSGAVGSLIIPGNVFYSTANNSASGAVQATSGVDYTAVSGSISFPVGDADDSEQTSNWIKVPISPDSTPEGAESFLVKLSTPVNGQLSTDDAEQVFTILDNDQGNLPYVVIENAKLVEGADGATTDMVFKVKLVNSDKDAAMPVGGEVVVTYSTGNDTAAAGSDYIGVTNGTITFAAGETEKEIRIAVNGDSVDEIDEAFKLLVSGATFKASGSETTLPLGASNLPAPATGTITNDDLTITLDPLSQGTEGNGTNTITFKARIAQPSTHDVTFVVKTVNGTATATVGQTTGDYDPLVDQLVTIPAGETEATFTVTVNGDNFAETDESFTLQLSNPTDAILGTTSRVYTILNDDAAPTLTIGDASIVEGDSGQQNLVFTIFLSGATEKKVTVQFATEEGTAKSSGALIDFLARSGSREFLASSNLSQTKTIEIPILGDTYRELAETFSVKLSNAKFGEESTGVTIIDDTGTGEIIDDGDTTLGVIVKDQRVAEGDSGTKNLSFVIETTAPVTDSALSLLANTRVGSAQASDFTALVDSAVSIAVGQSQATVSVSVKGDSTYEASEFLFLDVTGFSGDVRPVGGTATTLSAYGVILNDDVNVVSGREFQYMDTDGDLVTVKFSKGTIRVEDTPTGGSAPTITFNELSALGGRSIKMINLAQDGYVFDGVSINMVAKPQVLVTGDILGDGKADVGTLSAAVLNPDLFQISSGIALGKVTIPGNLGVLIAGSVIRPAGVSSLTVGSFGSDSDSGSVVLGPIGKFVVNGDFLGNIRVIGDVAGFPFQSGTIGNIGNLIIKGALKGGTNVASGRITFTGTIGSATIGDMIGGSGRASGSLAAFGDEFNTRIGSLTVLGDIIGGSGEASALVNVDSIGSLSVGKAARGTTPAVEGNIIGGSGASSALISASTIGSVFINGDLRGGAGESSGFISVNNKLGNTRITGSILGSTGESSGAIFGGTLPGSMIIEGNVQGGSGETSGRVTIQGTANKFVLGKSGIAEGGSIIGGAGAKAGRIESGGNVNSFTAYHDIVGGKGAESGVLYVPNGTVKSAIIKGSILGGNSDSSVTSLVGSGYIDAGNIGTLTVSGAIRSGENNGTALAKSGGVFSANSISKLTVGSVDGNEKVPVVISALRSIGNATFGGDVQFLELLAGYGDAAADKPRGTLQNAGATIGNVIVKGSFSASSIVAGAYAGTDGKFGTADDIQTSNGSTAPSNLDAISRITSVVLNQVKVPEGVAGSAAYGIVAEHVKALKIGGIATSLNAGPSNDGPSPVGPSGSKLQIFEI